MRKLNKTLIKVYLNSGDIFTYDIVGNRLTKWLFKHLYNITIHSIRDLPMNKHFPTLLITKETDSTTGASDNEVGFSDLEVPKIKKGYDRSK